MEQIIMKAAALILARYAAVFIDAQHLHMKLTHCCMQHFRKSASHYVERHPWTGQTGTGMWLQCLDVENSRSYEGSKHSSDPTGA
jgi:hypothetical protein